MADFVEGNGFAQGIAAIVSNPIVSDFLSQEGASIQEIDGATNLILQQRFISADTNADDKIDKYEFDAAIEALPAIISAELAKNKESLFAGREEISYAELELQKTALIDQLANMDKNNNGRVDQSEFEAPLDEMVESMKILQSDTMIEMLANLSHLPRENIVGIISSLEGKIRAADSNQNDNLSVQEAQTFLRELMDDISTAKAALELDNKASVNLTK